MCVYEPCEINVIMNWVILLRCGHMKHANVSVKGLNLVETWRGMPSHDKPSSTTDIPWINPELQHSLADQMNPFVSMADYSLMWTTHVTKPLFTCGKATQVNVPQISFRGGGKNFSESTSHLAPDILYIFIYNTAWLRLCHRCNGARRDLNAYRRPSAGDQKGALHLIKL